MLLVRLYPLASCNEIFIEKGKKEKRKKMKLLFGWSQRSKYHEFGIRIMINVGNRET